MAAEKLPIISPAVAGRIDALFDPLEAVKAKSLRGGTAPEAVERALAAALARMTGGA